MLTIKERREREAIILDLRGTLVRPQDVRGELRLVEPGGFVGEVLRPARLDAVIRTLSADPDEPEPSRDRGPIRRSAVGREVALWREGFWGAIYRIAAAACDELPV